MNTLTLFTQLVANLAGMCFACALGLFTISILVFAVTLVRVGVTGANTYHGASSIISWTATVGMVLFILSLLTLAVCTLGFNLQ
ncbi:hypothetical protein [Galliscardovia ingluviei]|uniref:hypothetical protein n=1 Tax=Galliscardovia ingluviei TaxID=1769422 RepID=UPI001666E922|nr:hypothetical protein [Galliscardovia ingluviei]